MWNGSRSVKSFGRYALFLNNAFQGKQCQFPSSGLGVNNFIVSDLRHLSYSK